MMRDSERAKADVDRQTGSSRAGYAHRLLGAFMGAMALLGPGGAAVAAEFDILVGSCYTNNVLRFDGATGRYLGEFIPAGAGGLACPEGEMILGQDGLLYVTSFSSPPLRQPWEPIVSPRGGPGAEMMKFDRVAPTTTYNDQVLRFDAKTGEFVDVFLPSSPLLNGPHGMALTRDGSAIVATRFSSSLLIYDPQKRAVSQLLIENGRLISQTSISRDLSFRDMNGVALGPDGKVYVSSYQTGDVFRFDEETGALLNRFVNSSADHHMHHPHNVLFGPDGHLYVTNVVEGGRHGVLRFDGRSGKFMDVFVDGAKPPIAYPSDIAFLPDGSLALVDCAKGSVLRYDGKTGQFLGHLVPPGSGLPSGATSIVVLPK